MQYAGAAGSLCKGCVIVWFTQKKLEAFPLGLVNCFNNAYFAVGQHTQMIHTLCCCSFLQAVCLKCPGFVWDRIDFSSWIQQVIFFLVTEAMHLQCIEELLLTWLLAGNRLDSLTSFF